ncbi:MAG: hypothetical protein Q9163_003762 [Psora crenata]
MAIKRKSSDETAGARSQKRLRTPSTILAAPKEEPAFPRGGASVLTPLEHKQIQIQAKQDVLFEQATGKKAPRKDFQDEENEDGIPFGEGIAAAKPTSKTKSRRSKRAESGALDLKPLRIEGLSYKRLVPGSLVLGQVYQINKYDLALSLPNNLTGYVPLSSISDTMTKKLEAIAEDEKNSEDDAERNKQIDIAAMFSVGQYLRAYVTSTEEESSPGSKGKRHITLSINPRETNTGLINSEFVVNTLVQAAVLSVEDHGLIMDLGLRDNDVRGFMSSKELRPGLELSDVQVGAVYLCLVTGQSLNAKTIKLSMDPLRIGNVKKGAYLKAAPTVDAFLPGTAVDILMSKVTATGVVGKVMGILNVTADLVHSGAASSDKSLEKKYATGSKVKGRVICTFPISEEQKLGVSLQDHLVHWEEKMVTTASPNIRSRPTQVLPISSVVEQATVVKVEPHVGLLVDVGVEGVRGFVHISRISEAKIEMLSDSTGNYKLGSVHKARIVGYNALDGLFIVSLEPKVISQQFLRLEDVKVGQVVKGSIKKLLIDADGVSGLIVDIADGLSGLVPRSHLSDVLLQHPERKFKEGQTVTARVLSTHPESRQMRLTLKKALVNSDVEPWSSYSTLRPGMRAPGTLLNILPTGAVVQFYGSVRAFMPVSEMSESFIEDPKEHFQVGQVVNVHIVSLDSEQKRMVVSCKDPAAFGPAQQEALSNLKLGSFVNGSVSEKLNEEIIVELDGSGLKARLPVGHLTDGSVSKSVSAAKRIRLGQPLQNLIVVHKQMSKRIIRLTAKPSIVKAAREGKLPTAFGNLEEDAEVVGYVNNITAGGVFVQFAGDLSALLPKSHLPEELTLLPDFGMWRNQSVSSKISSIDYGNQRFLLTMRPLADVKNGAKERTATTSYDTALSNPVDEVSSTTSDFSLGKITKAKINSVKGTQLNVQLADRVQGRIDVSSVFDKWEDIIDKKHPLRKFQAKQVLPVRILGMHDSRNHRFLPITHRNKAPVFELTAKQSDLTMTDLDILTLDKVKTGTTWIAYINNVAENCLWVNLSPNVRGRIRAMDASNDVSLLEDLPKSFPVGSAVKAKVLKVDIENNRLDLTAKAGQSSSAITLKDLRRGQVLPGKVTKVTDRHIMVQLSELVSGPVYLVDMADDFSKANPWSYKKNQAIRVCIRDIDVPNKRITLSTRPSLILSSSLLVEDPDITSISQLKVDNIRRGFINNVNDNGLFISLSHDVTAFCRVADLSDLYIKDWKSEFEVDQLVKGKVIAIDSTSGHVQMSLKQSHLDRAYKPPLSFNDVKVGQVVTGKVRKVEDFGVFVVFDNSANVSGLCHKSNMSDQASVDPNKLFEEGDAVQAKILSINKERRQISLGLKASYFEPLVEENAENIIIGSDDSEASDDDAEQQIGGTHGVQVIGTDSIRGETSLWENVKSDEMRDNSNIVMRYSEGGDVMVDKDSTTRTPPSIGLSALRAGGFDWTGGIPALSDQSPQSQRDSESEAHQKKQKRRKNADIMVDRTGELDVNGPQSTADFERLLLGQPNSSMLWLSYMAFQLQLGEVIRAREIAERALKTIHIREESEKLNVWVALLNLENTYGSKESLDDAFKRACEYNDSEEIHERLISIYIQSGQHREADDLFQATIKKHTQVPAIYLNYATFLMTTLNQPDRARALLPRAMQALPSYTHLNLTSKFAQLEFNSINGEAERGRTIFETLLSQWPKRLDLWNVLLDLEIKHGDRDVVRRLFERVTGSGMNLKPRKAKFFFKRWLEYEETVGDEQSVGRVTALAAEYVRGHNDADVRS